MYLTNERVKPAIDERIERRVFVDDRPRFTVLPIIDMWGRVQDERWPDATPRFTPGGTHFELPRSS